MLELWVLLGALGGTALIGVAAAGLIELVAAGYAGWLAAGKP